MLLARNDRGAMETLVKRYTDAVWHQVRQFRGASEPDDLAQEGFLGLISAVCFHAWRTFFCLCGQMHYKQHCICVAALPQFTVTCGDI